ncbi:unnamed protein product [Cylindrotheca closterium]|uniref:Uncharacterized protein n=1 Tax=Cylindrotheca closterium TaxID=2856 RepID=A0AAD2FFS7_9STRA|nr:unnamed protein product [Cylindrotheca closterium]
MAQIRAASRRSSTASLSSVLRKLAIVIVGCMVVIVRVSSPESVELNVNDPERVQRQQQIQQNHQKPVSTTRQLEMQKPPLSPNLESAIAKPITEPSNSKASEKSDEESDEEESESDEEEDEGERKSETEPPVATPTDPPTGGPTTSSSAETTATAQASRTSCQRHCPKRINRIFFHNKPAGLLDRELTYHVMSNLAGYLCALVEIPPPSVSLQAVHNHNKMVDTELRWIDFFNMTFVDDGTSSLLEANDNPKFPADVYWGSSGTYKQADYPGWKIVVTSKKDNMTEHYQELQEFSFQQSPDAETGFIWEIHKPYFKSELRKSDTLPELPEDLQAMLGSSYSPSMQPFLRWSPSNVTGCNYVDDDQYRMSPTQLEPIREAIRARVRSLAPSNTSVFGFFHIRRGDGTKSCNTTLPVLKEFFDCSIAGTEQTGKHITFLLGSDEHDDEYRQAVMDLSKDVPHISMLDADKIVDSTMQEMAENGQMPKRYMNNYHQFEFLKTLGMDRKFDFASVHLIRRRNVDCQECTNLLKTYPEAWS